MLRSDQSATSYSTALPLLLPRQSAPKIRNRSEYLVVMMQTICPNHNRLYRISATALQPSATPHTVEPCVEGCWLIMHRADLGMSRAACTCAKRENYVDSQDLS